MKAAGIGFRRLRRWICVWGHGSARDDRSKAGGSGRVRERQEGKGRRKAQRLLERERL